MICEMYETDLTKGVYRLKDFCDALKDNNCIVVRNVFNDWQTLVGSTKYDSIRFVITTVHDELKFGFWIACKHDLIITDYAKQQWLDFFCLSKETENIWERLLFQSAVKPVEKDYWNKIKSVNVNLKQSFKIDEVLELIRKNLKSLNALNILNIELKGIIAIKPKILLHVMIKQLNLLELLTHYNLINHFQ